MTVLEYLKGKTSMTPQDAFDFQGNVNTCLLYRIQQLEENVVRLEKIVAGYTVAGGGKEQPPASPTPE